MTKTQHQRRTLSLALPTAVLTTVATAIVALPAHAETFAAQRPAPHLTALSPLWHTTTASSALRQEAAPAGGSYSVQPGDTLWDIALRFGTTVGALIAANGLSRDSVLQPGQILQVSPASAPTPAAAPAPAPAPSASCTVAAGDTLWSIAQEHGTTVAALYAANGLGPDSIIYPGQTLRLDGAAAAPDAAAAPAPAPAEAPAPAPAPTRRGDLHGDRR